MTTQPQITIVGLGLIGSSLGLALKRRQRDFLVMGHDRNSEAVQRAQKQGAIDHSHWNLLSACESADLIVLAIPAAGIAPTLQALSQDLKPGCLIMDTAPIKRPVLAAAEVLPETVHFVGGNPILATNAGEAELARADLFEYGSWALCPTPNTAADAIRVAADFVTSLGATPLFLDAGEHDGLMAIADGMPGVLAAALLNAAGGSRAWREIRRMAGQQFETASHLPDFEPEDLAAAAMANSSQVADWIDALIEELREWQKDLRAENAAGITARYSAAIDTRTQWLKLRARGAWEGDDRPEDTPSFWRRLFGMTTRRPPKES